MTVIEEVYKWNGAPVNRSATTHLILHHAAATGVSTQTIHSWHLANGWRGIAYHYYIRKDGSIYRGRPENSAGGHTTNWNWCSIGICFEGNFETESMPEAQLISGQMLIGDIISRYPGICVGKHSQYQATACPGKNFPFGEMLAPDTGEAADSSAEEESSPSPWAADACEKAVAKGIYLGDGNGRYGWHECLTKQDFAVLASRLGLLD